MNTTKIGKVIELQAISGGGNMITEAYPTYHHTFTSRRMILATDSADRYREVTATEMATIKAADEAAKAQGLGVRSLMTAVYESVGAVFNDATGYYELNGLTDITEAQMAYIYNGYVSNYFPERPYAYSSIRTNIVTATADANNGYKASTKTGDYYFFACGGLEVANAGYMRCNSATFTNCYSLREIRGGIYIGDANSNPASEGVVFKNCRSLVTMHIYSWYSNVYKTLNLSWSPLLDDKTITSLLSANNSREPERTIYFHHDVYEKILNNDELLDLAAEHNTIVADEWITN